MSEKTELAKQELDLDIIEKIVTKGDLSGLNQQQKLAYLKYTCKRLELDPAAQPFNIISFKQGGILKEVLYCTKAGAEQLTKNNKASHQILKKEREGELYIVEARASLPDGRFVDDVGVVSLKVKDWQTKEEKLAEGNELANLMLKAVTKAKRRATLSLLGLGMMDETETETLINAKVIDIKPSQNGGEAAPTANGNGESNSPASNNKHLCVDCGVVVINPRVIEFSKTKYGQVVCYDCQELRRNPPKDKSTYLAEGEDTNEDNEII